MLNCFFLIFLQNIPDVAVVVVITWWLNRMYSMQHYVIKFVSDLRQVGGFLRILRYPPSIKLTDTI